MNNKITWSYCKYKNLTIHVIRIFTWYELLMKVQIQVLVPARIKILDFGSSQHDHESEHEHSWMTSRSIRSNLDINLAKREITTCVVAVLDFWAESFLLETILTFLTTENLQKLQIIISTWPYNVTWHIDHMTY